MLCKLKEIGIEKYALYWNSKTAKFSIYLLSEEEQNLMKLLLLKEK